MDKELMQSEKIIKELEEIKKILESESEIYKSIGINTDYIHNILFPHGIDKGKLMESQDQSACDSKRSDSKGSDPKENKIVTPDKKTKNSNNFTESVTDAKYNTFGDRIDLFSDLHRKNMFFSESEKGSPSGSNNGTAQYISDIPTDKLPLDIVSSSEKSTKKFKFEN